MITTVFDFIFNIDQNLLIMMQNYGIFVYFILFLIIFSETGLVVMPFLPGDSLIFACGTFAAIGGMNLYLLLILLIIAAILGDTVNYLIGRKLGKRIMRKDKGRFINKNSILKTQAFFDKHGGKTIFLARFVPIIRTFAPFVAGVGHMEYKKFGAYNISGGITWVSLFLLAGYFFGNIPIIKENFSIAILIIILVSLIPSILLAIDSYKKDKIKENL